MKAIRAFLFSISLMLPVALWGSVALPYATSFEAPDFALGDLHTQGSWSVDAGSGNVVDFDVFDGLQSIQLLGQTPFSQASIPLSHSGSEEIVYVEFAVKPYTTDLANGEEFLDYGSARVAFFNMGSAIGEYHVFEGSTGTWLPTGVQVTQDALGRASKWSIIRLRVDFRNELKVWDISIDGLLPVMANIGLADPLNGAPTELFFLGNTAGPSGYDDLSVGFMPIFPDWDLDGISDLYEAGRGSKLFEKDRYADVDANGLTNIEAFVLQHESSLPGFPADPIYYLKFSDDIQDSSSSAVQAFWIDDVASDFAEGLIGRAVHLDGTAWAATLTTTDALYDMTELTMAFWFKKDVLHQKATLVSNHNRYGISLEGANELRFRFKTDQSNVNTDLAVPEIEDTEWHHFALTYDGAKMLGFVDGQQVIRRNITGVIDGAPYRHPLRIGKLPWESTPFKGLMDELRVYDRALTRTEINTLAGGGYDFDGDGLPNAFELEDPEQDPEIPWEGQGSGTLVLERWDNLSSGTMLPDLTNDSRYPYEPTIRSLAVNFKVLANQQNYEGNRLRGWLHAPVTGDYHFWVKGHADAELYLSPNASIWDAQKIASLEGSHASNYDIRPSQASAAIHLEKGQRYYIELIHTTHVATYGSAEVAWQIPGLDRQPITKQFFSHTNGFTDDDLDGLRDEWELLHFGDLDEEPGEDPDGDGIINIEEQTQGTLPQFVDHDPSGQIKYYYVDSINGQDSYNGKASVNVHTTRGPKQTLAAALAIASSGDVIFILEGTPYNASDLENINIDVTLKAVGQVAFE